MRAFLVTALLVLANGASAAPPPPSPASHELEAMTWTELRDRIAAGSRIALLPIGGTEQSGPAIALGKHNVRARVLAARIAASLGDAIVAPVLAYVPEGSIAPPTEHMRWPGTISVPVPAFEAVLEGAARSLCSAGFGDVFLLGDHGGYQASLGRVAAALSRPRREPAGRPACRVHALDDYYAASQRPYAAALAARGHGTAEIGRHAGLADASLALAADRSLVRADRLGAGAPAPAADDGVQGDPRRASAELGEIGLRLVVDASVAAIRRLATASPAAAAGAAPPGTPLPPALSHRTSSRPHP